MWRSLVARLSGGQEAAGANPATLIEPFTGTLQREVKGLAGHFGDLP